MYVSKDWTPKKLEVLVNVPDMNDSIRMKLS